MISLWSTKVLLLKRSAWLYHNSYTLVFMTFYPDCLQLPGNDLNSQNFSLFRPQKFCVTLPLYPSQVPLSLAVFSDSPQCTRHLLTTGLLNLLFPLSLLLSHHLITIYNFTCVFQLKITIVFLNQTVSKREKLSACCLQFVEKNHQISEWKK